MKMRSNTLQYIFPHSFALHFLPIKRFEAHWHRDPVATHMSAILYQYWYWADRSLALSKFDLAFVFWLMLRRSFRNRQQRSRLLLRGQSLSARRGTPRVVLPSEPLFGLFKSFRRAWEACSVHCPAWNWTVTIEDETASRANGWREGWTSMAPDRTKLAMSSDVGRCVRACGCALGCWCAGVNLITAPFRCSATCPWTFIMATVSDTKARFHRIPCALMVLFHAWNGMASVVSAASHPASLSSSASSTDKRKNIELRIVLSRQADHLPEIAILVTNIIQSIWIQDSRFKAQKKTSSIQPLWIQDSRLRKKIFNPTCLDSRFKIQGAEQTSSIQPLWIQDSRFKAQKKLFNPTCLDSRFKIQGSEKTSSIPPVWIEVSRFKIQCSEKTSSILPVWIQDSRLKAEGLWIQEVLLGSWILNLESYPLGCKKSFWDLESWILPPWMQEVFLGSWILNPTPLDARSLFGILNLESYPLGCKKSFWDLESWILPPWMQEVFLGSWILNPTPLDARSLFGILNLESYPLEIKKSFWDLESWILPPWIQEVFLGSWILNPTPLDSRSPFGILNLESWFRCT